MKTTIARVEGGRKHTGLRRPTGSSPGGVPREDRGPDGCDVPEPSARGWRLQAMKRLPAALLLVVSLAACSASAGGNGPGRSTGTSAPASAGGATSSPTASPGIEHPAGATDLVLRVDTDGGFVPAGWLLTHVPGFSLYGDGRVVTVGAQIMIYPAPALPSLVETRLTEAGIQAVLRAAQDAGLFGADRSLPLEGIADAPTTTFRLTAGGGTHVTSAYALGMDQPAPDPSAPDAIARQLLVDFQAKIGNLSALVGPDQVPAEAPYAYSALRVYVDPYQPQEATDLPAPSPVAWPGPSLGEGTPVEGQQGTRCVLVEGAQLDAVLPALRSSNAATPWTSGGATWTLRVRPLLPDESGCARR